MPVPPPKRTYPMTFLKHDFIGVLRKEDAIKAPPQVVCPTGVYEDIPTSTPDRCKHTTSMCWRCSDIWHKDYYVRPIPHGLTGRNLGCLCQTCKDAASKHNRKRYKREAEMLRQRRLDRKKAANAG